MVVFIPSIIIEVLKSFNPLSSNKSVKEVTNEAYGQISPGIAEYVPGSDIVYIVGNRSSTICFESRDDADLYVSGFNLSVGLVVIPIHVVPDSKRNLPVDKK